MENIILDHLEELIIIINEKKMIILSNQKAQKVLEKDHLEKRPLSDFIYEYNIVEKEIDHINKYDKEKYSGKFNFLVNNKKILCDVNCKVLKNQKGERIGILIVARVIQDINYIKIYNKITSREAEIVQQILEGHPNRKIAETLCITENTVKRHITNIYNKLTVNNKIELFQTINDHKQLMNEFQVSLFFNSN